VLSELQNADALPEAALDGKSDVKEEGLNAPDTSTMPQRGAGATLQNRAGLVAPHPSVARPRCILPLAKCTLLRRLLGAEFFQDFSHQAKLGEAGLK